MTRSLLSFITLYGLSFSIWGTVRLCQFFEEKLVHLRSQPVGMGILLASGGIGIPTFFMYSIEGIPLNGEQQPTGYPGVEILLASGGWGLLASFTAARSFKAYVSDLVFLAFAIITAFSVISWQRYVEWNSPSFTDNPLLLVGFFGVLLVSGGLGLGVARVERPNQAREMTRARFPWRVDPKDVAVLIPAHNEEKSIGGCLKAVTRILPPGNIYVASDGSTDNTAAIVQAWGCNAAEINPGRGKARALNELLTRYDICKRYKAVMILDADSEVDPHYLEQALPLFDDPSVAAIAGHAYPNWTRHLRPSWRMFFIDYRVRLYKVTQAFLRYRQTWRYTNVSFIIPGFASLYRSSSFPRSTSPRPD